MTSSIRRRGRGPGAAHLAALVGYAVLTVVMTWPLARHVTTAIPGDSFDGWQNFWNLWWIKLALVDRVQNPYVTDLLYYPTGVGLYFHTLNPFNGLLTLPVQLAAGLFAAYNAVVLTSWVLAGYGTFLLARWVMRDTPRLTEPARWLSAWGAGVVFAFAPVHMAHLLGHMQVMALQWLPFYMLALLRGVTRSRDGRAWRRDASLAGLCLILAGLCDWYFVLYLFLFTGLVTVWAWLTPDGRGGIWRRVVAPLAPAIWAGAFFALALAPVLWPMVSEATRFAFMVRPTSDLYILSASLLDFVIPNRLHTLWREAGLAWPGNQIAPLSERTLAIGYAALAPAVVAATRVRRGTGLWVVAAIFFVLMAMGPALHVGDITWADIPAATAAPGAAWSPYALLNRLVPFMRISRSVSRFTILVQMSVAVLAGMGLAHLAARRTRAVAAGLVVAVLAVVLAEYWVVPYPVSPPDTPPIYVEIARQPGTGSVLNLPMNYDRPGYLLYQTVHGKPLTVAYISRDDPRTLTERVPVLQHWRHLGPDILADEPGRVGRTVLADLGVEWLVLDRYKMPGGDERDVTTALAAAVVAGQAPWFEDERVTVYHMAAPETPQAYLELGAVGWGAWQGEAEPPYRDVGQAGAEVWLRHGPADAVVRVTYRGAGSVTAGGAPVTLAQADVPATMDVAVVGDRLAFQSDGALAIVRLELLR